MTVPKSLLEATQADLQRQAYERIDSTFRDPKFVEPPVTIEGIRKTMEEAGIHTEPALPDLAPMPFEFGEWKFTSIAYQHRSIPRVVIIDHGDDIGPVRQRLGRCNSSASMTMERADWGDFVEKIRGAYKPSPPLLAITFTQRSLIVRRARGAWRARLGERVRTMEARMIEAQAKGSVIDIQVERPVASPPLRRVRGLARALRGRR